MSKNLSRDEQIRKDAADLHRWGYVQQLFRDMGGFSNFAISFSIISVITGAATLYGHGITWGGPMVYGWGWPIVTFFTLFVVASMAEIASAYPTAGAMYHWASVLGGPDWGWFTAWFNFIGQVAVLAGVDYGIALFLAPLLGLPETQTSLLSLYAIVLVSHGLFNHYGIRIVAWLNDFSVVYHILGTLLLIGALLWFAPLKPVSFAFKTVWTASPHPFWWAFLVGLLQPQWTLTGYDASAHTTEETVDPKRNAPWGMFLAVLISGVIGFLMNLVTTLAIQDLSLTTSSANPYLYIFETALGEMFGRIILWMVLGAMWFCGLSALTSSARMLFAFSRDRGLPGWRFLSQISVAHKTPAQATWVLVVLAFLIAIYSKSYSAIVSISVIGLYISYILPVILGFKARLRGKWRDRGPWHLGRWSLVINGVAIAWVGFISVLFVVPPNELAGYTFAGLLLLLTLYYFVWTRKHFKGPKQSS
ncbi:MAG: amino acid permease [Deltaproteobacteria bacterium]|nr:amino acid permease [Deltaproteobacteria bacterium]